MSERIDREEVCAAMSVRRQGDLLVGQSPLWYGTHVFGGILLGQALAAAADGVAQERRARSLHAYFVGAADARESLSYEVAAVKRGRSAETRAVTASQDDETVLTMICSFALDRDGYDYGPTLADDVGGPQGVPSRIGPGPVELALVGPTAVREDGTRASTHRAWMRIPDELPTDPRLHEALLAFFADISYNGACPWDLANPPDRTRMVSVDHATWFHRPARADEWLFYDVQSVAHSGGRGTIRALLYGADRRLVCSAAQELHFR